MEDEVLLNRLPDRRIVGDNSLSSGPPGVEAEMAETVKNEDVTKPDEGQTASKRKSKESPSRSRRRKSRSGSRGRVYSPDRRRRYEDRDPRLRRRSRERPRSPPSRGSNDRIRRNRSISRDRDKKRSASRDRYRNRRSRSNSPRRNRWSVSGKKGPVSPPPIQGPPPGFNNMQMPPQMYNDGYNNYSSYGQPIPNQQYQTYDYTMQVQVPPPQTFVNYPPPVMQPIPPGDDYQSNAWNMQQQQQATLTQPPPIILNAPDQQMAVPPPPKLPIETEEEKQKREAAVALEKKNQRATLRKQREDYKKRAVALNRELVTLKNQRNLLVRSDPPSPKSRSLIKENDRLQSQIETKISTIENVIDMLSGIIGNDVSPTASPKKKSSRRRSVSTSSESDNSSPERLKSKVMESLKKHKVDKEHHREKDVNHREKDISHREKDASNREKDVKIELKFEDTSVGLKEEKSTARPPDEINVPRINYVYYDPEMHWCKTCSTFPKTAKDYLTHLHTKEHQDNQRTVESPWHINQVNDEFPTYSGAPHKRTPIRGLQFFVQSSGWYCKLCCFWMGDLHCASAHLKSKTHATKYSNYIEQNPHFEVDWNSDRQKACEFETAQKIVAPPPPTISTHVQPNQLISDGIPLQLPIVAQKPIPPPEPVIDVEPVKEEKKKKKKKKHDEKKDKKKKKRSKKRKHESSSSSSSSSSDSDSDSDASDDKSKEVPSNSIRVAMRNLLKQQEKPIPLEESGGKWTVVQSAQVPAPPPPTISANGAQENKRDELMISQWNAPEPIITEKEKKLLEQLKGRLKNKTDEKRKEVDNGKAHPDKKDTNDKITKSPDNRRDYRRDRSRSSERYRDRRGRRSRSYGRRSRSRSPGRWGRRGRSRSRSRSRSRGRRVEKAIVRYPEFRPRVPEKDKERDRDRDKKKSSKHDEDRDRKKSPGLKKLNATPTTKKLPFIGRMPVFKKQTAEEEAKKDTLQPILNPNPNTSVLTMHNLPQQIYNTAPQSYNPYEGMSQMIASTNEEYEDLMPDPMQFVSLMGAPPPPPMVPPPAEVDDKPVLPPGIDEDEAHLAPKPISDAPLPRKGPLPQDFQDALSIIFPGERKPETEVKPVQDQANSGKSDEIISQNEHIATEPSMDYVTLPEQAPVVDLADAPLTFTHTEPPPPPPPPAQDVDEFISKVVVEDAVEVLKPKVSSVEMDDLAMLGIDADDMAAQCM